MFKMVKTLTTWWPVKVYEPNPEKPGTFSEFAFEIEFEIIDRDEVKTFDDERSAIFAEAAADTGPDKLRTTQEKLDALQLREFQRVTRNWRGVIGADDNVFPFTNENLLVALKRDHIREGINEAYKQAIATGKARLGN
ncbi:hypothetical protein [Pararhizobium sp. A13]|uniref:hypothetical protein n=1 Tax=Pararhizobium sp. A13 TaxID=3133975 RepID=UPI00324EF6FA